MSKWFAHMPNQFCCIGSEFMQITEDNVIGHHHPSMASLFESEEAARAAFTKEYARHENLEYSNDMDTFLAAFESFVNNGYVYRTFPRINHDLNVPYCGEDADAILKHHIEYIKAEDGAMSYEIFKTWPELHQRFECFHRISRVSKTDERYSGSLMATMSVSPTTTFDAFKRDFEKATSVSDFYSKQDDVYIIDVFEHTLSQYGSIVATYNADMTQFTIGTGFSPREFDSLEALFEYWQREYYYD